MRFLLTFLAAGLILVGSQLPTEAATFTDPEPNIFAAAGAGEVLLPDAVITATNETEVSVRDTATQQIFTGAWAAVQRYRAGGGPAEIGEIAVGDRVRGLATAAGRLLALQDGELQLCDQTFVGRVTAVQASTFTFQTATAGSYLAHFGPLTPYRDAAGAATAAATLTAGQPLRVHGVVNANTRQIFTETLGAHLTLLADSDIATLAAENTAAQQTANETAAATFSDVPADYRYRQAVGFAKTAGYVAGYPDGTFRPESSINRAEFTQILVAARRAAELRAGTETTCFADVPAGEWFARAVCTARSSGLLAGYPDGTFRPAAAVNLAEALKIVLTSFDVAVPPAADGQAWYAPYFAAATAQNLLPTDWTDPAAALSRGQLAELIWQLAQPR